MTVNWRESALYWFLQLNFIIISKRTYQPRKPVLLHASPVVHIPRMHEDWAVQFFCRLKSEKDRIESESFSVSFESNKFDHSVRIGHWTSFIFQMLSMCCQTLSLWNQDKTSLSIFTMRLPYTVTNRQSEILTAKTGRSSGASRFQSLTCEPIWTPGKWSSSMHRVISWMAKSGDCIGTVPSPTKRVGCCCTVLAMSLLRIRERSRASFPCAYT